MATLSPYQLVGLLATVADFAFWCRRIVISPTLVEDDALSEEVVVDLAGAVVRVKPPASPRGFGLLQQKLLRELAAVLTDDDPDVLARRYCEEKG